MDERQVGRRRGGIGVLVLVAALGGVIAPGLGFQLVPGIRFSRWDYHRTQRESLEARVNAADYVLLTLTVHGQPIHLMTIISEL